MLLFCRCLPGLIRLFRLVFLCFRVAFLAQVLALALVLRSFFPFLLALLFRYGFARRFGKGVRLGGIDILVFFRLLFLPFFQKLEHILISKSPSKYLIIANPT